MDKPMTTYIEKKENTLVYNNTLDKEILRKGIHCVIAVVPFMAAVNMTLTIMLLISGALVYLVSELLRLNGRTGFLVTRITMLVSRESNTDKMELGPFTLAAGAILALLLFPLHISRIAILALAFGDTVACIAGKKLSSFKIPYTGGKTFAGSISCFMAIYVISFKLTLSMPIAFALASLGTLLEALPLKDLDNITLPVGVGLLAYLIV